MQEWFDLHGRALSDGGRDGGRRTARKSQGYLRSRRIDAVFSRQLLRMKVCKLQTVLGSWRGKRKERKRAE